MAISGEFRVRTRGLLLAISGEFSWPSMGNLACPPSSTLLVSIKHKEATMLKGAVLPVGRRVLLTSSRGGTERYVL